MTEFGDVSFKIPSIFAIAIFISSQNFNLVKKKMSRKGISGCVKSRLSRKNKR